MCKWALLFALFILPSCKCSITDRARLVVETTQSKELAQMYDAFPPGERRDAAHFLIANIENKYALQGNGIKSECHKLVNSLNSNSASVNTTQYKHRDRYRESREYDLEHLLSDSMILLIDQAFAIWSQSSWAAQYSKDDFMEYVLPYRLLTEPLEYSWRQQVYDKFAQYVNWDEDTVQSACRNLLLQLDFTTDLIFNGTSLQSFTDNLRTRQGRCEDKCVFYAMVLRACGIPVAIDFAPQWGSLNNGHSWNALILSGGKSMPFNNDEDFADSLDLHGKVVKVYRKTFGLQNNMLSRYKVEGKLPGLFADCDLKDVTKQYVNTVDVELRLCLKKGPEIVYLATPNKAIWNPVAWGE